MSLYDDIDIKVGPLSSKGGLAGELNKVIKEETGTENDTTPYSSLPSSTIPAPSKLNLNLSFLKSQLEAKKALLQNAAAHQKSATVSSATPSQPIQVIQQQVQQRFKLKPHKAIPLPLDSSGAFTIVPKALKEDKVFLFGEVMVEDEYNPTAPTDYITFKQKREQQRIKEKIAKDIADRLARETTEEEEKRKKGAAIAPPSFEQPQFSNEMTEEPIVNTSPPSRVKDAPRLTQFGKGVSRGLGVAASIMSKMGYREGAGLGAKEQGISRPLEIQRKGKNIGLIVGEEKASIVVTHLAAEKGGAGGGEVEEAGGDNKLTGGSWSNKSGLPETEQQPEPPIPITDLLKSATKIVLLKNMVSPTQVDAEFEQELREEMAKYGQLVNVIVHQVRNCSSELEAIRVFLEYSNQAQAIKAVVDLQGRFFAGRLVKALFYPLNDYTRRELDNDVQIQPPTS